MVNLASGIFHHCIKEPCWGSDRDLSLSSANFQPSFGVGDEMDKVDGNLGVKQNDTILDYLYYFLQVMSQKRIWTSKKILDPLYTFGFKKNSDFEPPQFCILVVPPNKGFLEFFGQFITFVQKLFFYTGSIHALKHWDHKMALLNVYKNFPFKKSHMFNCLNNLVEVGESWSEIQWSH